MSPPTKSRLASTKTIISALGTVAATAMVVRTISKDYIPSKIQENINYGLKKFVRYFSSEVTMVINDYVGYENNAIYDATLVYLESKVATTWTEKSSLIVAMANYLKFDIYDLELTYLKRNSELRKLLIATANRSILVVEDIDCNIEL